MKCQGPGNGQIDGKPIGGLTDWRIGELANWRIGGLADWGIIQTGNTGS